MADYITDYSTVNTSAAQLIGREAKHYSAAVHESIAANATIKFGRAFQKKVLLGELLTLSDLALINATQSLRIALYSTGASVVEDAQYVQYDMMQSGKSGYYVVDCEEAVAHGDTVRVRLVVSGSDPLKVPGRFTKTADEDKTAVIEGAFWEATNIVFLPDSIKLVLDNLS